MSQVETCGRPPRFPALQGIVDRFWFLADAGRRGEEIKLPTPSAQILVNLDSDRLSTRPGGTGPGGTETAGCVGLSPIAPRAVMLDRSEQRRIAGIVIRPEALSSLARAPADELGALVGLDLLQGPGALRLREAAEAGGTGGEALDRLEEAFATMVSGRVGADHSLRAAIALVGSGVPVGEIGDRIGLSQSTLTRRFRAATGMTAKRYQRLLRLERAVGLAAGQRAPDWARIAVACGCYDQAHLTHEFAELAGLSPARWHRSSPTDPFHIPVPTADFFQDVPVGHQHADVHG